MGRCLFVIGTRAQLVKLAPVLRRASQENLPHEAWLAGQHHDSMDELLADFGIDSPIERASASRERASVGGLASWLPGTLLACRRRIRALADEDGAAPLVVVHGDTLSTLVGAVAARTCRAPVVHIESGLSSGRLFEPFPEELTRRWVFRLAHYALCPGAEAAERMTRYGCREVVDTGENTLLDCVRFATAWSDNDLEVNRGIVASIHRFENLYRKERLRNIVDELLALAEVFPVTFVLHPATSRMLRRHGEYTRLEQAAGVTLAPRMPYTRFLSLLAGARGVVTDGGSNQEELAYLGVPAVLFRQRSERAEGLGENVKFRHELPADLVAWVRHGGFDGLRRNARTDLTAQPSADCVAALRRWCEEGR